MRRRTFVILLVALLAVCHRPILRAVPKALLVENGSEPVGTLLIVNGDQRYEYVAEQLRGGRAEQVLLIPARRTWVVKCGARPAGDEIARQELTERGVLPEQIVTSAETADNLWQMADVLGTWLQENPTDSIAVVVDRLSGRTCSGILRAALPARLADRVHLVGLASRDRNLENWWHTRRGLVGIFDAYVSLLHSRVMGRPPAVDDQFDPDLYESRLQAQWPEGRGA